MTRSFTLAAAAAASLVGTVTATVSHQRLHGQQLTPRQAAWGVTQGCYKSLGAGFTSQGAFSFQSTEHCNEVCTAAGEVFALTGSDTCSCGTEVPPLDAQVDASFCSTPCVGYPPDLCGSSNGDYYSVYALPGTSPIVQEASDTSNSISSSSSTSTTSSSSSASTSSSSSASTSTSQTVVSHTTTSLSTTSVTSKVTVTPTMAQTTVQTTIVQGGTTIIQATTPTSDPSTSGGASGSGGSGGHSSSTIGIAVGVVVGVLALTGVLAGGIFYARRRRAALNAENGHRRADSLNAFVASGAVLPGAALPGVARSVSISDTRLDPRIMVENRRQSAGSIFADNQDYSRRILKVANPDDRFSTATSGM